MPVNLDIDQFQIIVLVMKQYDKQNIFECMLQINFISTSKNCSQVTAVEFLNWYIKLGSGIGLDLSGNKLSPELMLNQFHHIASLDHSGLLHHS